MNNFTRRQVTALIAAFFVFGFVVVFVPGWFRGGADAPAEEPRPVGDIAIDDAHVSHVGDIVEALADSQSRFSSQDSQDQQEGESADALSPKAALATSGPTGWDSIPRNGRRFEQIVVHGPLEAAQLLRNKFCNPRDAELSPRDQSFLASYCEDMSKYLKALESAKGRSINADFEKLIKQGAARRHNLVDARSRLPKKKREKIAEIENDSLAKLAKALGKTPEEIRADPTFSVVVPSIDFEDDPLTWSVRNGMVYSATPRDLPNADAALRDQRWATFEVGVALAQFFLTNGCLHRHESEALMADLVAEIESALGS